MTRECATCRCVCWRAPRSCAFVSVACAVGGTASCEERGLPNSTCAPAHSSPSVVRHPPWRPEFAHPRLPTDREVGRRCPARARVEQLWRETSCGAHARMRACRLPCGSCERQVGRIVLTSSAAHFDSYPYGVATNRHQLNSAPASGLLPCDGGPATAQQPHT